MREFLRSCDEVGLIDSNWRAVANGQKDPLLRGCGEDAGDHLFDGGGMSGISTRSQVQFGDDLGDEAGDQMVIWQPWVAYA
jgi:hypothetical protein